MVTFDQKHINQEYKLLYVKQLFSKIEMTTELGSFDILKIQGAKVIFFFKIIG